MKIKFEKKKKFTSKNLGFTVVETLVAVSILSISILAGFTAVQNGLKASINAKDQITAFYLIQDVMEFIKNKRDNNALASINGGSNAWLDGLVTTTGGTLPGPCHFTTKCIIDSALTTVTSFGGANSAAEVLRRNSTTGLVGYNSSWPATNFKRVISFQEIVGSPNEVTATVWISWTQGNSTRSFQVSENIFNHQ